MTDELIEEKLQNNVDCTIYNTLKKFTMPKTVVKEGRKEENRIELHVQCERNTTLSYLVTIVRKTDMLTITASVMAENRLTEIYRMNERENPLL